MDEDSVREDERAVEEALPGLDDWLRGFSDRDELDGLVVALGLKVKRVDSRGGGKTCEISAVL